MDPYRLRWGVFYVHVYTRSFDVARARVCVCGVVCVYVYVCDETLFEICSHEVSVFLSFIHPPFPLEAIDLSLIEVRYPKVETSFFGLKRCAQLGLSAETCILQQADG